MTLYCFLLYNALHEPDKRQLVEIFKRENSGDKNINREIHSLRKKCESVVADERVCHSKSNSTSEVRRCDFSKLHFLKCQLGRSGLNVPVRYNFNQFSLNID